MISNDNQQFVTVEILKSELGEIRTEIRTGFEQNDKEFKEIRSEVQTVKDIAIVNSAKIDAYKDFTSMWFTVIAVIVALIGFVITLAPMFREMYRDAKQARNQNNIREIVREIFYDEVVEIVRNEIKGGSHE